MGHVPNLKSVRHVHADGDLEITTGFTRVYRLTATAGALKVVQLQLKHVDASGAIAHETGSAGLGGGTVIEEDLFGMEFPNGLFVDIGASGGDPGGGLEWNLQYTEDGDPLGRDITQHDLGGDP